MRIPSTGRWNLQPPQPEQARALAEPLGLRPITGQLLFNRGVRSAAEAISFLSPKLSHLRPPEGEAPMAGFAAAVERLTQAVLQNEIVGVFGDYDVDGITTCALVTDFLRSLHIRVLPRIAHRNEGYGFGLADAQHLIALGCSLLITGDCGTSDHETLALCEQAGVDVIVVDHHQVPDRHPRALALLNPHQPECAFPFKGMASVGIAFYLMASLRTRLKERRWSDLPELRDFLDLVALGTVADLAPLVAENRILVANGLQELSRTKRPGLHQLTLLAGLSEGPRTVSDIAFRLAPRINAPGRLGQADDAFHVLTEKDPQAALVYAKRCEERNTERQQIQQQVFEEARQQANALIEQEHADVLLLSNRGWHSGVVGIVASKLVEEYNRPVVVIAIDGDQGRGSARTSHGFHLYRGLQQAAHLLVRFGGHAAAAGLSIEVENIEALRQSLSQSYREQVGAEADQRTLSVDATVELDELDLALVEEFSLLAPFGMGNPEPTLLVSEAQVAKCRVVGKSHLQVVLRAQNREHDAIAFGLGHRKEGLAAGTPVSAALTPEIDWHPVTGGKRLRLRVRELYPQENKTP